MFDLFTKLKSLLPDWMDDHLTVEAEQEITKAEREDEILDLIIKFKSKFPAEKFGTDTKNKIFTDIFKWLKKQKMDKAAAHEFLTRCGLIDTYTLQVTDLYDQEVNEKATKDADKEIKKDSKASVQKKAGTWSVPNTAAKAQKLKEIYDSIDPMPFTEDTFDEQEKPTIKGDIESKLYNLFGDDQLFDDIDEAKTGNDIKNAIADAIESMFSHLEDYTDRFDPKALQILEGIGEDETSGIKGGASLKTADLHDTAKPDIAQEIQMEMEEHGVNEQKAFKIVLDHVREAVRDGKLKSVNNVPPQYVGDLLAEIPELKASIKVEKRPTTTPQAVVPEASGTVPSDGAVDTLPPLPIEPTPAPVEAKKQAWLTVKAADHQVIPHTTEYGEYYTLVYNGEEINDAYGVVQFDTSEEADEYFYDVVLALEQKEASEAPVGPEQDTHLPPSPRGLQGSLSKTAVTKDNNQVAEEFLAEAKDVNVEDFSTLVTQLLAWLKEKTYKFDEKDLNQVIGAIMTKQTGVDAEVQGVTAEDYMNAGSDGKKEEPKDDAPAKSVPLGAGKEKQEKKSSFQLTAEDLDGEDEDELLALLDTRGLLRVATDDDAFTAQVRALVKEAQDYYANLPTGVVPDAEDIAGYVMDQLMENLPAFTDPIEYNKFFERIYKIVSGDNIETEGSLTVTADSRDINSTEFADEITYNGYTIEPYNTKSPDAGVIWYYNLSTSKGKLVESMAGSGVKTKSDVITEAKAKVDSLIHRRKGSLIVTAAQKEFVIHQVMIGEFTADEGHEYVDTGNLVEIDDNAYQVTIEDSMGIDEDYYFESEESAREYITENYGPKAKIVVASFKRTADTTQDGNAWVQRYLDIEQYTYDDKIKEILNSTVSEEQKLQQMEDRVTELLDQEETVVKTVDWDKPKHDEGAYVKVIEDAEEEKKAEGSLRKEADTDPRRVEVGKALRAAGYKVVFGYKDNLANGARYSIEIGKELSEGEGKNGIDWVDMSEPEHLDKITNIIKSVIPEAEFAYIRGDSGWLARFQWKWDRRGIDNTSSLHIIALQAGEQVNYQGEDFTVLQYQEMDGQPMVALDGVAGWIPATDIVPEFKKHAYHTLEPEDGISDEEYENIMNDIEVLADGVITETQVHQELVTNHKISLDLAIELVDEWKANNPDQVPDNWKIKEASLNTIANIKVGDEVWYNNKLYTVLELGDVSSYIRDEETDDRKFVPNNKLQLNKAADATFEQEADLDLDPGKWTSVEDPSSVMKEAAHRDEDWITEYINKEYGFTSAFQSHSQDFEKTTFYRSDMTDEEYAIALGDYIYAIGQGEIEEEASLITTAAPAAAPLIHSILEPIYNLSYEVAKEEGIDKGKEIVIDTVEQSQIKPEMKNRILEIIKNVVTPDQLAISLGNLILKYKGLGVIDVTKTSVLETEGVLKRAEEPTKVRFMGKDKWGRNCYQSADHEDYVEIGGVMYNTTEEGEPIHPVSNVIKEASLQKKADEQRKVKYYMEDEWYTDGYLIKEFSSGIARIGNPSGMVRVFGKGDWEYIDSHFGSLSTQAVDKKQMIEYKIDELHKDYKKAKTQEEKDEITWKIVDLEDQLDILTNPDEYSRKGSLSTTADYQFEVGDMSKEEQEQYFAELNHKQRMQYLKLRGRYWNHVDAMRGAQQPTLGGGTGEQIIDEASIEKEADAQTKAKRVMEQAAQRFFPSASEETKNKLWQAILSDYEEGGLNTITIQDVVEIFDAMGFGDELPEASIEKEAEGEFVKGEEESLVDHEGDYYLIRNWKTGVWYIRNVDGSERRLRTRDVDKVDVEWLPIRNEERRKNPTFKGKNKIEASIEKQANTFNIKNGVVYDSEGNILDATVADELAQANGVNYAENFVKEYEGKQIEVDDTMKILKVSSASQSNVLTKYAIQVDYPLPQTPDYLRDKSGKAITFTYPEDAMLHATASTSYNYTIVKIADVVQRPPMPDPSTLTPGMKWVWDEQSSSWTQAPEIEETVQVKKLPGSF